MKKKEMKVIVDSNHTVEIGALNYFFRFAKQEILKPEFQQEFAEWQKTKNAPSDAGTSDSARL